MSVSARSEVLLGALLGFRSKMEVTTCANCKAHFLSCNDPVFCPGQWPFLSSSFVQLSSSSSPGPLLSPPIFLLSQPGTCSPSSSRSSSTCGTPWCAHVQLELCSPLPRGSQELDAWKFAQKHFYFPQICSAFKVLLSKCPHPRLSKPGNPFTFPSD